MADLDFNYAKHGELPLRDDAYDFASCELFHQSHDSWWTDLVLEATGMTPVGVPYFQFCYMGTRRRITIQVPCEGVVAWVQVISPVAEVTPFGGAPKPQIAGFVRIEGYDDPNWEKVKAAIDWTKIRIVTSMP